ncbi:LLM class oxidoreductase [Paraburkholderia agricolaris]|uniref:LLM class oxidoreductase n=1 Tax=Paraburkholderia agricolaris TaxID=2152888 RepID=A0ABW8ZZH0_9BURK
MTDLSNYLPVDLVDHRGFARVFQPGRLTFGFVAPLEGYPDSPGPTLFNHEEMVRQIDQIGISALWLRDVPFYDPSFGDVGQVLDPMVYAGWLAAVTQRIAIGTAGIVAPLRHPLFVAKQAASVDQLLGGRFLLGLASGDRPGEYPSFGLEFENRAERYRDALSVICSATESHFSQHRSRHYGALDGTLDLIPKPVGPRLPIIAVGRAGQSIDWIAENADAWIWHGSDARSMTDVIPQWRIACGQRHFKPYGYGTWFDMAENPDEPLQRGRVLKAGRRALIELWKEQEAAGVSHVILNLKQTRRPAAEVLDELAEYVLPVFPSHDS